MNKLNKSFNKIIIVLVLILVGVIVKNNFNFSYAHEDDKLIDNTNLEIYFFDVGQADSILIKKSDNTMLIDAGNNSDGLGLVKYINDEIKINDIDVLIGTHPHEDHIGGIDDIINNFDIGKIYLPDATTTSKTFEDMLDAIENKKYEINIPEIGEKFYLGELEFEVLYTGTDESDLNNTSIVLKMKYGNNKYLFMGDATSKSEKKIINKNIDADVIKVGHHGSSYSTLDEFLKRVNPKYAIIQVGENNKYNHPSKSTLDKFENSNVKVYRTDIDGTIKLISDGENIRFEFLKTNIDG